jgi:hypothetical protein
VSASLFEFIIFIHFSTTEAPAQNAAHEANNFHAATANNGNAIIFLISE